MQSNMGSAEQVEQRPHGAETGEIRILPPTTLKDLGIKGSDDIYSLASEPFTLRTWHDRTGRRTIYEGFFDHPFLGLHLLQLGQEEFVYLNDTLCDFGMPERAAAGTDEDQRLHNIHLKDPRIGYHYREFVEENLDAWVNSLENKEGDSLFFAFLHLMFINEAALAPQFFSRRMRRLSGKNYTHEVIRTGLQYEGGEPFCRFLKTQPEFTGQEGGSIDGMKTDELHKRLYAIPHDRRVVIAKEFLKQVPREEWNGFVFTHLIESNHILIDPKQQRVWQKGNSRIEISFPHESRVTLSDGKGNALQVDTFGDGAEPLSWKVFRYEFSAFYQSQGLYPLIAWEKTEEGKRRFLSQHEVFTLPLQRGDVFLGRVLAAYFSREIVGQWPTKMSLRGGHYKNYIMAAQLPVWVSLDNHAQQLLSDNNPFFRTIEEYVLKATSRHA